MHTLNLGLALLVSSALALACQTRTPVSSHPAGSADTEEPPSDGSVSRSDAGAMPDSGSPADDTATDGNGPPDGGPAQDSGSLTEGNTTSDSGVASDGGTPGTGAPAVRFEVNTWEDFSELATPQGELKFLLPVDADAEHRCWFQDTERYPYHLQFLRSLPQYAGLSVEAYDDMVLARDSREFHAGVVRLFAATKHPRTEQLGILTYTVYTASTASELLGTTELTEITQRLASCMGSLAPYLVYLPEGNLALSAAEQQADELERAGITWIRPGQLQGSLEAAIYSAGEAYGYVRRVTNGDVKNVGPRDVVVTQAAPSELGLVAALLTAQVQSSVSHLNLRLREKHIPNAAAPELFASGLVDGLEGALVHVETSDDGLAVTPARLSDAQAFWETQAPVLPDPEFTLDVTEPEPLASLHHDDLAAFGTKAANLGELGRALPRANVPDGIGLPFAAYAHHVAYNGLEAAVTAAAKSAATSSPETANEILSSLRKQLKQAPLDPTWESELLGALDAQFGDAALTTRLRFRSSTNVEDLPGLSGAGLYDSASGCYADDLDSDDTGPSHCLTAKQKTYYEAELVRLRAKLGAHPELTELGALIADAEQELSEEKSARKALRKVWASLWNDRAFQDREYYRIDHSRVFMGVAVHPSLVGEQLESVLVTNLEPESSQPLYRVESQAGEVGVVEPQESDAVSERLQFRRSGATDAVEVALVTASSFSTDGKSLWSDAQLTTLTALVFQAQDHFAQHVYSDISPLQLDLEVDVASDGTILVKQARPYVSGAW
jgi:pyruvate,water dikinase